MEGSGRGLISYTIFLGNCLEPNKFARLVTLLDSIRETSGSSLVTPTIVTQYFRDFLPSLQRILG